MCTYFGDPDCSFRHFSKSCGIARFVQHTFEQSPKWHATQTSELKSQPPHVTRDKFACPRKHLLNQRASGRCCPNNEQHHISMFQGLLFFVWLCESAVHSRAALCELPQFLSPSMHDVFNMEGCFVHSKCVGCGTWQRITGVGASQMLEIHMANRSIPFVDMQLLG